MRAEQWMMLGVGAIGVYAVYRLTRSTPTPMGTDASVPVLPMPNVPPPVLPDLSLPVASGPIPRITSDVVAVAGNPLKLREGQWYKGRLELDPTTSPAATAAALAALGFGRIEVYATPSLATPVIQHAFALASPGQGTRWFRARVPVGAVTSVPRPSWMTQLWVSAAPATVTVGGVMYPVLAGMRG